MQSSRNRLTNASNRARRVLPPLHSHKLGIADNEAVQILLEKLLAGGPHQERRDKLLKALDEAAKRYEGSSQKERQAFFHGLLTGYAVALKLW